MEGDFETNQQSNALMTGANNDEGVPICEVVGPQAVNAPLVGVPTDLQLWFPMNLEAHPVVKGLIHLVQEQQKELGALKIKMFELENATNTNGHKDNTLTPRTTGHEVVVIADDDNVGAMSTPKLTLACGTEAAPLYAPDTGHKTLSVGTEVTAIGKRLFHSPDKEGTTQKKCSRRAKTSKFRITSDMDLNRAETMFFGYIFAENLWPEESLVKILDVVATRKDLLCLCVGQQIDDKIIMLVTLMNTCTQQHLVSPTCWWLTPSFADDVRQGKHVDQLITKYVPNWIRPSSNLEYVYIPVEEIDSHWFLVVIDIRRRLVYHVDSYPNPIEMPDRLGRIRKMCRVLFEIMTSDAYGPDSFFTPHDLGSWTIRDAKGIPNEKESKSSAAWVLSWLQKEGDFDHNMCGKLFENTVRARTALGLVMGPFNQLKNIVEDKATVWVKGNRKM